MDHVFQGELREELTAFYEQLTRHTKIFKYCTKSLDIPVKLPCGESVCRSHMNEIIKKDCRFCDYRHYIENERIVNKSLDDIINIKIQNLKLVKTLKKPR